MKAMVRQGGALAVVSRRSPGLPPGGLLLRVGSVGICGTDYQLLNGQRPGEAEVLGHEGYATVIEVSQGCETYLRAGRRVVFSPVNAAAPYSVLGHSYDGLLQEFFAVDRTLLSADLVHAVPDAVPALLLPLAEPLATVIYGVEIISHFRPPRRWLVLGCGGQGLLRACFGRRSGSDVRVVTSRTGQGHRAVPAEVVEPASVIDGGNARRAVSAWTNGVGADVVSVCVHRRQAERMIRMGLDLLADGGVLELVSAVPEEERAEAPPFPSGRIVNNWRRLNTCGLGGPRGERVVGPGQRVAVYTGHRGSSGLHMDRALSELSQAPGLYERLISHRVSLEQAAKLVSQSARHPLPGLIKLVIDVSSER